MCLGRRLLLSKTSEFKFDQFRKIINSVTKESMIPYYKAILAWIDSTSAYDPNATSLSNLPLDYLLQLICGGDTVWV
jgi:hypothetical protein